uniref:STAS domain-containing protein n=1 Tax=Tetradesmus obliquus TaxID=3088 RepID=A0A383W800_TETOB|eukprot:jgi/Sobl393_1/373/SZX72005.1
MERTFGKIDADKEDVTGSKMRRMSLSNQPLDYPFEKDTPDPFDSAHEELDSVKAWWRGRQTRRSKNQYTAWSIASTALPCLGWLRGYKLREWLLFDLMAGLAVAFTVVPQGMSYANITGLPAVMGLYGAFLPVLIYALFGSCRQLGVGPVAVTSGLIFSGMAGIVPGYDGILDPNDPKPEQVAIQAEYNKNVIQLAFLVACLYTAVGLFRLGFLIRFLSHPVITGFTSGAALVIAAGQVKYLLGVSYKKQDTLQGEISNIIAQLAAGKFKWQEFVMGFSMLAFLLSLKFIQRKWPKTMFLKALGPFLACSIGIAVVAAGKWGNGKGPIKIVKNIPQGLPPVSIQDWVPIGNIGQLLPLAFIVLAVDMLESTSIARALARKNGYDLKYNQEIVALGLANFAGAMFSSYTTTGSFSRSAINNSCGAKTNLSGFVTSIIVMCVLLFLTPVFRLMPYNTMGAIIIVGVIQLVEVGVAYELFRTHLRDFFVWLVAFVVTTFAGVEYGLMSSIALSLLILVLESSFPHSAQLGRLGKSNVYRSVQKYPGAETIPGIVIVRLDAPLFFANTNHFENSIADHLAAGQGLAEEAGLVSGVRFLVLDLSPVTRSDSSGAHMLLDLAKELQEKGVQLVLANPTDQLMRMLERIHIHDSLPRKWVFVHTHDAVRAAQEELHNEESSSSVVLITDGNDITSKAGKASSYATHQQ